MSMESALFSDFLGRLELAILFYLLYDCFIAEFFVWKETDGNQMEWEGEKRMPKTKKAETAAASAKMTVSRVAKKPVKETFYLQYGGREVSQEDLMRRVKEIWRKQLKRKVGEMATVTLYLKPEENRAYYVINGEESGYLDI